MHKRIRGKSPFYTFLYTSLVGILTSALAGCSASYNMIKPASSGKADDDLTSLEQSTDNKYFQQNITIPYKPATLGFIVVIIDDMGINQKLTKKAITLPAQLTLSYLPYAINLEKQLSMARLAGHDIMLHLPMEPYDENTPLYKETPDMLMVGMNQQEIENILTNALRKIPHAVAINNHMGSRFTEWEEGMAYLLQMINNNNLLFVDSKTTANSAASRIAKANNWLLIERDVFIDHDADQATINRQLMRVEQIARKKGYVIAIGHPTQLTLRSLESWITTLKQKNLKIIPLSQLLILLQLQNRK